jgi:hypothetical protein
MTILRLATVLENCNGAFGVEVLIPTLPVVTLIDDAVIIDTVLRELTFSVENALVPVPVPVPGTLLLILDTVRVDSVRNDATILDMLMVVPFITGPISVEAVMVLAPSVGMNVFNVCTPEFATVKIEPVGANTPGEV